MQIKGMDGQSYNVTGQGQGNFNTVGAAAGIASFLGINGGNLLGRNAYMNEACSENALVNRYELSLVTTLASKDGEIALLKADKYTDQKIVEATTYLQGEIGKVADKLEKFKDEQNAINLQQTSLNATQTSTIKCMQQQIAELNGNFDNLTKNYVPSYNVCQQGSCCNPGQVYGYGCGAQVLA